MKKPKPRQFIWSTLLLIIGIVVLLMGYNKIALLLVLYGIIGIIWIIYGSKKEIKLLSKEWTNYTTLILILGLVIWTIISEYKWTLINIILCGITLIAIYLWYRLTPWLIKKGDVSWF